MSKIDYVIACPYCKRQYRMKLDREEIIAKKTRATCGRCGNSFELATRIQDSAQAAPSTDVDLDAAPAPSSAPAEDLTATPTVPMMQPAAPVLEPAVAITPAPLDVPPAAPRSWTELADPGLGSLREESTPALLVLEQLL